VLIEGNSFLRFIDVDFAVLVAGGADTKIKSSARWAFQKASAVYQFDHIRPYQKLDREGGPVTHLALPHCRASDTKSNQTSPSETVELLNRKFGPVGLKRSLYPQPSARLGWTPVLPAYAASDFPKLLERINQIHSVRVPRNGPSATADGSDKNGIARRLQGVQS
jgi:hypothetical protein